jgi:23S rRNA pseudouridine955/2504/2580 synthase
MARGEHRFARMFLHARQLAFDHPATAERVQLEAALPTECTRLLESL